MVYIEPSCHYGMKIHGKNVKSSHLIADSESELVKFALKLGFKADWIHHSSSGIPHFDVVESRYGECVKAGAIEVNARKFAQKLTKFKNSTRS